MGDAAVACNNSFKLTPRNSSNQVVIVHAAKSDIPVDVRELVTALKALEPKPNEIVFESCTLDDPLAFFAYMEERPTLLPANTPIARKAISVPFAGSELDLIRGGERVVVKGGYTNPIDTAQLLAGISALSGLKKLEFQDAILDQPDSLLVYCAGEASHKLSCIGVTDETEFANLNTTTSPAGRHEARNIIFTDLARALASSNSRALVEANIAGVKYPPLQDLCQRNAVTLGLPDLN